ncbi:MAG: choice-of-anchor Q domain-containing protein, partial [Actinomycetota bacterium]
GGGIAASFGVDLQVIDSEISNNDSDDSSGGGIFARFEAENVLIQNSTISDNFAFAKGGGIYVEGGVPTSIENSVVSGNSTRSTFEGNGSSDGGGGIYIEPPGQIIRSDSEAQPPEASLIVDSTINENTSAGIGGGILVSGGCCGLLEVFDSTISNNGAQNGGGIFNNSFTQLENVTISSNYAHFSGGGVYNVREMDMNHVTVYRNEADNCCSAGGIFDDSGDTVEYQNSIIAKNTFWDCEGTELSLGNNLLGDDTCDDSGDDDISPGTDSGNDVDPGLAPLRLNGGPTRTHELLPHSLAIDGASGGEECPAFDQRGLARFTGLECDIGAYEVGSFPVEEPETEVGGVVVTKKALCRRQNPTILGTLGPDRLVGTSGVDVIQGLDANDVILGKGGDDIICGSLGNDVMKGQGGDDFIKGLRGDDKNRGGPGTDRCIRGPGEDKFFSCENVPRSK